MNFIISLIITFLLLGCSGSKDGSSSNKKSILGLVVDGKISGASVCIDKNINGKCDEGEPTTTTNSKGEFSFSDVEVGEGKLYPIIASGGTDTATGKVFTGELKKIIDPTDSSSHAVTPLTDLSASSFLNSTAKDSSALNWANFLVSQSLQISMSDLEKNPLSDAVVFSKAQEIVQLKNMLETSSFKAVGSVTDEEKNKIKKNISDSLVKQMEFDYLFYSTSVNVTSLVSRIEGVVMNDHPTFDIPSNEASFIENQMAEIKVTLAEVELSSDLSKLTGYQAGLVDQMNAAEVALLGSDGSSTIGTIAIPDDLNTLYKTPETPPDDSTTSGGSDSNSGSGSGSGTGNSGGSDSGSSGSGTGSGSGSSGGSDSGSSGSGTPADTTPIAVAGVSFSTTAKSIKLDGSKSSDPNSLALTYQWTYTSKPAGSLASMTNANTVSPTISLDKFGDYIISLTVDNGSKTASHSVTITLQKTVEYTNPIADNSVPLISDHLTKEAYTSFTNGFYYDTSSYNSLQTTKINSNGVRVEKINIASDSSENLNNYDSTYAYIYRTCIGNVCFRGLTNTVDRDKVLIEKLDHENKVASEYIISSKAEAGDSYVQRSAWNFIIQNNSIYLFRKLYVSLSSSNYGPFDTELIKLNLNFEVAWDKVIKTSGYGTSNGVYASDVYNIYYIPWLILNYYNGKLFLYNSTAGSRSGVDYIIINDSTGVIENTYQYLVYENNVKVANNYFYPTFTRSGKIIMSNFYNYYSGTKFSSVNGVVYFNLDENLNSTIATAVSSNDPNYFFSKSYISDNKDILYLSIMNKTTGAIDQTKLGHLYFSGLNVDKIDLHHNLLEYWANDNAETLNSKEYNFVINNNTYTSKLSYTDLFNTKTSYLNSLIDVGKNFLSVRYGNSYDANDMIELDETGTHSGCFESSSTNQSTLITNMLFTTKSLEVRRGSYDNPPTSSRIVTISSHARSVVTTEIEERAPWLCSSYALDLDTTIRTKANYTTNVFAHDTGYYRYTVLSQPTKGVLTIYQPSDFSITGNTIVQYKANADASGTETFRLLASDGTGSKVVNVTVVFK